MSWEPSGTHSPRFLNSCNHHLLNAVSREGMQHSMKSYGKEYKLKSSRLLWGPGKSLGKGDFILSIIIIYSRKQFLFFLTAEGQKVHLHGFLKIIVFLCYSLFIYLLYLCPSLSQSLAAWGRLIEASWCHQVGVGGRQVGGKLKHLVSNGKYFLQARAHKGQKQSS